MICLMFRNRYKKAFRKQTIFENQHSKKIIFEINTNYIHKCTIRRINFYKFAVKKHKPNELILLRA
jgi:hypothetical protein